MAMLKKPYYIRNKISLEKIVVGQITHTHAHTHRVGLCV